MKRSIGDKVLVNPYSQVTGEIISSKDNPKLFQSGFDYVVKLNIPHVSKDTIYTANYNTEEDYWWQYFNDDELDILEKNYNLVSNK